MTLPLIAELNSLPRDACTATLESLFEAAPAFNARVCALRPYSSYAELVDAAESLAERLPHPEQVDLINGHPRIGALASSMSAQSQAEQGADESAELQRRLDGLNARYEERFGFRYTVFVAGRPRSEIATEMDGRLTGDGESELRRAVSDVFAIARDRLTRLQPIETEVSRR